MFLSDWFRAVVGCAGRWTAVEHDKAGYVKVLKVIS
jgi:hypothetical protein